jgi:hypothetical protein
MDGLAGAGLGLLVLIGAAALVYAARHQTDMLRAARRAVARRKRVCRYCGEPAPSVRPGQQWTCSSCGYDLDASGEPYPDQFEGKKRRVLRAVAKAEAQPPKKGRDETAEHVRPSAPGEPARDDRGPASEGVQPSPRNQ